MEQKDPSRSASLVAEQILWLRRSTISTPMHILKLAYLSHGWMLGLHDRALIVEPVEAWQYGPVIANLYHRYKAFGGDPITLEFIDRTDEFTKNQQAVIEGVVNVYFDASALELSNITHNPDTPWDIVRRNYGPGAIIPNELIREHYKRLAVG